MNAKKSKKKAPPGAPAYHRLTEEQRIKIETLWKAEFKLSKKAIAEAVHCHPSTVSRELVRNRKKKVGYEAKKAQATADYRARAKAKKPRKLTDSMWAYAMKRLKNSWSFGQIVGRARREGVEMVCAETLYKEYYRRKALGEDLPALPMRRRQRKRRNRDNAKKYSNAGRGKIKDRVDIDERPKSVENRARGGNWEGDLINGAHGTGHLVTVAERMTRFTPVGYVATKETDVVIPKFIDLLGSLPRSLLVSVTFDNGKEFAAFKKLEQALGLDVYFAKPYHSWERGTNENRNGIVRKVLPKGSSFADLSEETLKRIDYMLNDRPLKCLNWRTPREAFVELLSRHMDVA